MPETELSDSELIKAFGEGDHAAFETLYHRYRRQLYGFLSNLIPGNPAEVDEVFEETWLRVIDKLPKYRDDGKFSAWLFRVSRNLFIDRVRRNRPPGNGVLNLDAEEAPEIAGPASMSPERELDSADLERVYDLFPRLRERRKQVAGTLSGGEQQMLAMGRALMSHPKLLMLDEPSMGLAPILVEQIFSIIQDLHRSGSTILLVEQNAQAALNVADRGYVLETGKVVTTGTGQELLENPAIKKAYLGG